MATTTPTGRVFPVPDLVGQKAAHAIEQLRDLGLTPVPLPAVVADLSQAGYVLGLDPPPTSPVRAKQRVTLSVATHPDFDGRAEAGIDELPSTPVQPPLAWPQSADAGVASPEPEFDPRALSRAPTSAATPGVSSSPAPSLGDAAFGEFPHDRGDSRADSPTSGVAAEPYEDDLAASVPTPDDYAALDEWHRMRAAEEASYANEHAPAASANTLEATFVASPIVQPEQADVERERVAEEEAKREARRRSARRYRRLTIKQKLIVGAVFALTLVLVVAAASSHKPRAHRAAAVTKPTKTEARAKATKHRVAPKNHKPAAPPKQRAIVVRTHTRTRSRRQLRPAEDWIRVRVPAIITEDIFEAAQRVKHDNTVFSPRRTTPGTWLLRGLVVCGNCGVKSYTQQMSSSAEAGTRRNRYYSCPYHDAVKASGPEKRCTERRVRADELDAFVFDQIREILLRPDVLLAGEKAILGREPAPDDELLTTQLDRLTRRVDETAAERRRITDLYQTGHIDMKELDRRATEVNARHRRLETERDELKAQHHELAVDNC